jgi:hypothetical protein
LGFRAAPFLVMATEYYEESEMAEDKPKGDDSEMSGDEDTFLAPKYAFGEGCKPGDKYTVEVVSVMEDEIELKHVKKAKEEKSDEDETEMELRQLDG